MKRKKEQTSDQLSDMCKGPGAGAGAGDDYGGGWKIDELLQKIKEPPSYSHVLEEIDTSDACLMVIDGPKLKEENFDLYNLYVRMCFNTRRKCMLQFFSHPGDKNDVDDGVCSREGRKAQKSKSYNKIARAAITEFNRAQEDVKLELEKLIKVNYTMGFGFVYYMTFSATNKDTGEVGIYQAVVRSEGIDKEVLHLFRDWSNDKNLAFLSITGAEDDFAPLRKRLEHCIAGAQLRFVCGRV